MILDTTQNCSKAASCLKLKGVTTLIRYYCRPGLTWKRMSAVEAIAISKAGLSLAAVYQNRQSQDSDFSEEKGYASGKDAFDYAENVIFQPRDSAIYFSVDYDASQSALDKRIVPFFEGVQKAFTEQASDETPYEVGVYGSGRTCRVLKEAGLVTRTWITQSTGFAEYQKFLKSGEWDLKQLLPLKTPLCGLSGDPNEANPAHPGFGEFTLDPAALGPAAPPVVEALAADTYVVNASSGLRMRAGPGVDYEVQSSLPPGAIVQILSRKGDWAQIDATGDGLADGYVFEAYLKPASR
jgi:hypothetical protein